MTDLFGGYLCTSRDIFGCPWLTGVDRCEPHSAAHTRPRARAKSGTACSAGLLGSRTGECGELR